MVISPVIGMLHGNITGDRHAFLGLSSTYQGSTIAFLHGVVPSGVCAMFSG
jgi:hypothetical protein